MTLATLQILIDQFKMAISPLKGISKIFWTPTEVMLPFRAIYFSGPCVKLPTFQTVEIDQRFKFSKKTFIHHTYVKAILLP